MICYAVDDEPLQLKLLVRCIEEVEPTATVYSFFCGDDLLAELNQGKEIPDVVFLDIELPNIGGIELAWNIKLKAPKANIIFVTGFSQYALEAYSLRPSGYILKPVSVNKVQEELQNLRYAILKEQHNKLRVQCFGNFEVFDHEKPVRFKRGKTKELFAFLIDRRGAACTTGEMLGILWEDDADSKKKSYVSNLSADLIQTFEELGYSDIIIKHRGVLAVASDRIDCDYYDWNKGIPYAVNSYHGEYMSQFSWAEMTLATIH